MNDIFIWMPWWFIKKCIKSTEDKKHSWVNNHFKLLAFLGINMIVSEGQMNYFKNQYIDLQKKEAFDVWLNHVKS